jgi:hypothetical protein
MQTKTSKKRESVAGTEEPVVSLGDNVRESRAGEEIERGRSEESQPKAVNPKITMASECGITSRSKEVRIGIA